MSRSRRTGSRQARIVSERSRETKSPETGDAITKYRSLDSRHPVSELGQ